MRLGSMTLQNSEQDEIRVLFSGIKRCKKLIDLRLEFISFSRRTGQEMSNPGPLIKCLPNLQVLNLSLTGWKKDNNNDLPPALSQLKALKTLNLNFSPHFQLNPQYMASLVSSLKACNNLTELVLEFKSSKEITQALFSLLKHLKSLKYLRVSLQRSKDFIDDALKELSESLKSLNSLQILHLELRNSIISNLGLRYIADSFQYLSRITTFSFEIHQNSTFDSEGVFYLCRKIKSLSSLSTLALRFLHSEFDQQSIGAFAVALRNIGQIKNLILDFNEIHFKKPGFLSRIFDSSTNETGAFNLLSALSAVANLSSLSLNLHGFDLKLNELQALNQSLGKMRRIERLKLELIGNKNSTKDESITALFRTLRSLPLLSSLTLSFSHVNDEDFEYISIQLEDLYGLCDLNLKFEGLRDVSIMSARQLGLTLGNLSRLSTLNLKISCGSGLRNKGAEAILLGLEKLKHLENLVIYFGEGPSLTEIQTVNIGDNVLIQLVNSIQNLLVFAFNNIFILG